MDRSSRLGRRRLSLISLPRQLCPITIVSLLLLQAACNSPLSLIRWRSTRPLPPQPASPDGALSRPDAGAALHNSKPPEVTAALKKPALPPESIIARPEIDATSGKLQYNTVLLGRTPDPLSSSASGWQYRLNRENRVVGFEVSNRGGNRILPDRYDITRNLLFMRDFQFRFDDRARQDIHLSITDWAPSADRQFRLSELMNSIMVFLPRNYLPAISNSAGRFTVTLPTGEQIQFDGITHEIVGGVLAEAPVDLTPNRAARKFPALSYSGKGVIVRANARGADPRIGTTATIITGSPAADCKGRNCEQCTVPSRELWNQSGAVTFKFPTDAEFDRYLRSRCGFGLPAIDSVIASTSNG